MTPTDAQVEELARWLDETHLRLNGFAPVPWDMRPDSHKRWYRNVARALLERPPPVLLDALGGCAPDAVAGRGDPCTS